MTGRQMLDDLAVRIYEEPLLHIRNAPEWPSLTNPLHLTALLVDFDTEVAINGILGFLENSSGAHLDKTIDAFIALGAHDTAEVLQRIREVLRKHGVSHQKLRSDFKNTSQYEITSFSKLHGASLNEFAQEVCAIADLLYSDRTSQGSPFLRLEVYLEEHASEIQSELSRVGS